MNNMRKLMNAVEGISEARNFYDGQRVKLTPEYAERDNPDEVFTLTQWDGKRGWIADDAGRGWRVQGYQIKGVGGSRNAGPDTNYDGEPQRSPWDY